MSTTDKNLHPMAAFARKHFSFYAATVGISANSEINGRAWPYLSSWAAPPPYTLFGWQIENVQVFCTALTATVTVIIDNPFGFAPLAGNPVPVAGSVVQATLNASLPQRRGQLGHSIRLIIQTNGTGTISNLLVTVTVRPFPLSNEAA